MRKYRREGKVTSVAIKLATEDVEKKMKTLAALHNPDLIGGGKDIINDFGDRQVNSSIGPQWKSRVKMIDEAVQKHLKHADKYLDSDLQSQNMNASLERCK